MSNKFISARITKFASMPGRLLLVCLLLALMSFSVNVSADTADTDQQADETGQEAADDIPAAAALEEEVNTNDPTAAAISVSFGWEFFNWHEDEIAPGETRPTGNNNNFNSRVVIPMAKGTLGSPWPIINRFSFANVEAPAGPVDQAMRSSYPCLFPGPGPRARSVLDLLLTSPPTISNLEQMSGAMAFQVFSWRTVLRAV